MKKAIIIIIIISTILTIFLYNLFKPRYYNISLKSDDNTKLELSYNGILTKGFNSGTLGFNIDYINSEDIHHAALYIDDESEPFLGWGINKSIFIIDKSLNKNYSSVNKILNNKDSIYLYLYDDIDNKNIIAKYKVLIEKRN